jgi:hypothetical protein
MVESIDVWIGSAPAISKPMSYAPSPGRREAEGNCAGGCRKSIEYPACNTIRLVIIWMCATTLYLADGLVLRGLRAGA